MEPLIVLVLLVAVVLPIGIKAWSKAMTARFREQELKHFREARAQGLARETRIRVFVAQTSAGWSFHAQAQLDGRTGVVMMDDAGARLRLVMFACTDVQCTQLGELEIAIGEISSVRLQAQTISKVVTHNETAPVAVMPRRKAGASAFVGALIAGETGAIIGAASSLGQPSIVEYHAVDRKQTVTFDGVPKVVLTLSDLNCPTVAIQFANDALTDEWVSRIEVARSRGDAAGQQF